MSGAWFFIIGLAIGGLSVWLFFRNGDSAALMPPKKAEPEAKPDADADV